MMLRAAPALFALALFACSQATQSSAVNVLPVPRTELVQPYVLVVTGPTPCAEGQADLGTLVHADAEYAASALGLPPAGRLGATGAVLENPSGTELTDALNLLANAGSLAPGLVFVYSGHGIRRGGDQDGQSMLCLRDGALAAREVLAALNAVPRAQLPFTAMVLNACESAYVDISSLSMPTAVLAASKRSISVHAFSAANRPAGSCAPGATAEPAVVQATAFVRATVNALAKPSSPTHDRNEDGIVTMHELLHVLADSAAKDWFGCSLKRPEPKFQLQARSEVPIRYHADAKDTRRRIESIAERLSGEPHSPGLDALLVALRAQLDLPSRRILPEIRWDFVITDFVDAAMRVPPIEAATSDDRCWSRPPYLALAPAALPVDEQRAVGQFSIFSRFYEIERQGQTVDVTSLAEKALGDPAPLKTLSLSQAVAGIPPRMDKVDGTMFRAMTAIPNPADCQHSALYDILRDRHFRVCSEGEGQCFVH
jgi:hypothetical protein